MVQLTANFASSQIRVCIPGKSRPSWPQMRVQDTPGVYSMGMQPT